MELYSCEKNKNKKAVKYNSRLIFLSEKFFFLNLQHGSGPVNDILKLILK